MRISACSREILGTGIHVVARCEYTSRQIAAAADRNYLDGLVQSAHIDRRHQLRGRVPTRQSRYLSEITIWAPFSLEIASRRLATLTALPMTVTSTLAP